jgi:hypothetical protein
MERLVGKEKIHPNEVLNDALSFYVLKAAEEGAFSDAGSVKARLGMIEHLTHSEAYKNATIKMPEKEDFEAHKNTILSLGQCAYEAYKSGKSVKDVARGKFDPRLIAYAPQALLFYSYLPPLENLKDIVTGKKEYGYGKELNRTQPHNSMASGEMMKPASARIAETVADMVKKQNLRNLAIFEIGCGNASFSASVLETFKGRGLELPKILATDLDPNTQPTARFLFQEKGFLEQLGLMKVDMGSVTDIKEAGQKLEGKNVIIHIGYILHEHRPLAEKTLSALTKVFGGRGVIFAFSEYYNQEDVTPEVPLWFQTIHAITQDLFDREEFIDFVDSFGLKKTGEVVHNTRKDNGQIVNSTTFWENR